MKEYFVVKVMTGTQNGYFASSQAINRNESPLIGWTQEVSRAYRHDSYVSAFDTNAAIAKGSEKYLVEKIYSRE